MYFSYASVFSAFSLIKPRVSLKKVVMSVSWTQQWQCIYMLSYNRLQSLSSKKGSSGSRRSSACVHGCGAAEWYQDESLLLSARRLRTRLGAVTCRLLKGWSMNDTKCCCCWSHLVLSLHVTRGCKQSFQRMRNSLPLKTIGEERCTGVTIILHGDGRAPQRWPPLPSARCKWWQKSTICATRPRCMGSLELRECQAVARGCCTLWAGILTSWSRWRRRRHWQWSSVWWQGSRRHRRMLVSRRRLPQTCCGQTRLSSSWGWSWIRWIVYVTHDIFLPIDTLGCFAFLNSWNNYQLIWNIAADILFFI